MCSMPGQHDVVDVVAAAADEAVVLDPLAARAHPADLDLVERLASRLLALRSAGVSAAARMLRAAAHSTDLTMFW